MIGRAVGGKPGWPAYAPHKAAGKRTLACFQPAPDIGVVKRTPEGEPDDEKEDEPFV